MTDITKLADSVFASVKLYIERHFVQREADLGQMVDKRIAELPVPKDGTPGERGADGLPGAAGRDGVDGKDGAPGRDGVDGTQGEKGADGLSGKDGAPGADGQRGADGAPGAAGERGEQGPQGERGEKGEPGEPGAPGPAGETGPEGPAGAAGAAGIDGKSISTEEVDALVQRCVAEAVQKAMAALVIKDGADGRDGRDGQKGEPGRDAAQLDILPSINEQRTYARGTFATHKGGLWRTTRTTDGMDGWECLIDGVAEVEYEPSEADPRIIGVKTIMSSGKTSSVVIQVPAMRYCGVFRDGEEYAPGDTVTWGGSLWHCNAQTKEKPLDGSKSWQLAAKRGRDGKDGRDGIDMTKPVKL